MSNEQRIEIAPAPAEPGRRRMSLDQLEAQERHETEDLTPFEVDLNGVYLGTLWVTYLGNAKFHEDLERRTKQWRATHSKKRDYVLKSSEEEPLIRRAMVGTVVGDFHGFERGGKPLANRASPERYEEAQNGGENRPAGVDLHVVNLLSLLESRTIRAAILAFVANRENFFLEELEDLAGN